jgi:release factor glutamine methyltransferase
MPDLMAEVKDFEPSIALDGGFDGLDFIRRIFAEAAIKLKKTGILAFEHGHGQREAILSLPEVGNNFECKVFGKDLCARERFLIFTRRKK